MYEPKPIDTANVVLPEEIKRLIERLGLMQKIHNIFQQHI